LKGHVIDPHVLLLDDGGDNFGFVSAHSLELIARGFVSFRNSSKQAL